MVGLMHKLLRQRLHAALAAALAVLLVWRARHARLRRRLLALSGAVPLALTLAYNSADQEVMGAAEFRPSSQLSWHWIMAKLQDMIAQLCEVRHTR